MKRRNVLMSSLLSIGGGLLACAANEPYGLWPLMFLAVASLARLAVHSRVLASAWWSFVWGLAYFIPLFDWATSATGTYLAQIALGTSQALFLALVGIGWNGLFRHVPQSLTWWRVPVAAVLFVGVEMLRSVWPFGGMPWGTLAFAMVDSPLVRLAPFGSTQLVSFVTVCIAIAGVAGIAYLAAAPLRSIIGITTAWAILVISAFIPIGARPGESIRVGIVQGGVPEQSGGTFEDRSLAVTQNHVAAALEIVAENPDIIVMPESTSDLDFRENVRAGELITQLTDAFDVPILVGTQNFVADVRYNQYVVLEDGEVASLYSKQHPVPFGEYVPYRDFFRSITSAVDQVGTDMAAGSDPAILDVNIAGERRHVAVPICFEIAYTSIVAEAVIGGAELIITPTNNSTFVGTGEPSQQFAISKFRAIEFARSVVQVSTSGITGVVNPSGVLEYSVTDDITDARVVDVALNSGMTFATSSASHRELLSYILAVLASMVALAGRYYRRAERINL